MVILEEKALRLQEGSSQSLPLFMEVLLPGRQDSVAHSASPAGIKMTVLILLFASESHEASD